MTDDAVDPKAECPLPITQEFLDWLAPLLPVPEVTIALDEKRLLWDGGRHSVVEFFRAVKRAQDAR